MPKVERLGGDKPSNESPTKQPEIMFPSETRNDNVPGPSFAHERTTRDGGVPPAAPQPTPVGPYPPNYGGYRGAPPPPAYFQYGPPQMYPPGYPPYGYPGYGPFPVQHAPVSDKDKAQKGGPSPGREGKNGADKHNQHAPRYPLAIPGMALKNDRMRAAEEIHPDHVKPIRTNFHYFVDDVEAKLRHAAEEKVGETSGADKDELDLFQVNTDLNSRLIKEWESSNSSVRATYLTKEEGDRSRFISDDEVASRHCATLTARSRSPRPGQKGSKGAKAGDSPEKEASESPRKRPSDDSSADEPFSKVPREEV